MKNFGFINEIDFVRYIDKHPYVYFSKKWKKHLKIIFPFITDKDIVRCYKHKFPADKPDVVIECRFVKKYISLKTGHNPPVHKEYYKNFYLFLDSLGISRESRDTISLYQYGLSKKLGIVGKPLTRQEIIDKYSDRIYKANLEINNENIIKQVAYRTIIKGAGEFNVPIDFFYYGSLEKGLLISVDQIYKSVCMQSTISSTFIHFGELVYQPCARNRHSSDYKYSRVHWPILSLLFYKVEDENDITIRDYDKLKAYKKENN